MKTHTAALLAASLALLFSAVGAAAQGSFQNLDFEAANIPSGTQVGSMVPIISALPGWSASFTTYNGIILQQNMVWYDGITLGSAFISINDTHAQGTAGPLQGSYSLLLAGGNSLFEGGLHPRSVQYKRARQKQFPERQGEVMLLRGWKSLWSGGEPPEFRTKELDGKV